MKKTDSDTTHDIVISEKAVGLSLFFGGLVGIVSNVRTIQLKGCGK